VKRGLWIALLAGLAFAAVFLARLPAAWVIPTDNPRASCASVDGSIWSGACAGLALQRQSVGDLTWQLQPLRLLRGRLAAHLTLKRPGASAQADLEAGLGERVTLRHLVADLPLDPEVTPGVPGNLRGRAHADITLARIEHGVLTELQGRIEVHDLEDRSVRITRLGSYVVSFPGGAGEPAGKLRDLDGPLAVEGTVRLTRQGGYQLDGLIAPRAGAAPELINNIRFLGSPDATGRRPFSAEGTF
jgi:general secretion pathway protein N